MFLFAFAAALAVDPPAPMNDATPTVATAPLKPAQPAAAKPVLSPDGFQTGGDTLATVVAKLGKPNSTSMMSDGTKIIVYVSNHAHVKATSFIPVVGLFASGAKGSMSIKTFTFGVGGLLESFTSSDSNSNCNVSIAGGGCH